MVIRVELTRDQTLSLLDRYGYDVKLATNGYTVVSVSGPDGSVHHSLEDAVKAAVAL